ncbi:hypothetical protein MIND_01088400 [Mycena indigotica]|uniref:EH domain-containing protein n=1 Tax=Mycena indigotica TaxID=2126181 RepID=A0A8H6SB27_9AGAR|nr:uncharacterized protein MIND_01088400 [Mycena indigotica]KAF7295485.1 hypothetical protein MIND_01088400 [Mycena indigotica]
MSVQSRIHAFESGAVLQPRIIPSTPPKVSPSPSPPNLGRKSSLIDLKIDLKEWVFDEGSPPRTNGWRNKKEGDEDALIHFSPPKKAPPLPPRKPSLVSLKTAPQRSDSLTVEHTYPPLNGGSPKHTHGSSISSFHSVSLSDGSPSPSAAVFPQHRGNGTPTAAVHTTGSNSSIGSESFEELTASTALVSPATAEIISQDWERAMNRKLPPKLPARPPKIASSPPPPTRRAVPPPPTGDRASIRSFASASSSTSLTSRTSSSTSPKPVLQFPSPPVTAKLTSRPPPVPPGPRRRYDALFSSLHSAHLSQNRETLSPPKRRAAGWRGLSVDLIRDPAGEGDTPSSDILPGNVVRVVWCRSRLPKQNLSSIWTECDPQGTGSLDRDAFARGMWRIDEELRHAAEAGSLARRTSSRRVGGIR